jgi:sodium/bile acid cotransporter 7
MPEKKSRGCFKTKKWTWPCVKAFLLKNFLVVGLITAIVFSLAVPWPGREVASWKVGSWGIVSTINIVTIFIISGLTLQTDHIKDAVRQWPAALIGTISILLITPCAGFVLVALPFSPPAYSYGLAIFALVPTTIASGITLVTAARGNAALALMLTIVTNVLGVFILPFTIPLVISQAQSVSLNPTDLLIKLVMTILIPLIIGKILRESSAWIRKQVAKHKVALGLLNNGSLICIVWLTLSSAQEQVVHTGFGTLCLIFLAAILLHVVYLIVNYILVKIFRLPHREAAAVLIMGSEKTLPMAVTVIAATGTALGSTGQLTVPCVLAHISQVLIDAFLCDYIGKKEEKRLSQAIPITADESVDLNGTSADESSGEKNGEQQKRVVTVEPVAVVLGSAKSSASKLAPSTDGSPPASTTPAENNV